jgi:hypothetical protein
MPGQEFPNFLFGIKNPVSPTIMKTAISDPHHPTPQLAHRIHIVLSPLHLALTTLSQETMQEVQSQ